MKNLRSKVKDYKNFGYILLVLSAYIYIGVIIPEGRSPFQLHVMMGSTLVLLSLSFIFFMAVIKYKKQMEE